MIIVSSNISLWTQGWQIFYDVIPVKLKFIKDNFLHSMVLADESKDYNG